MVSVPEGALGSLRAQLNVDAYTDTQENSMQMNYSLNILHHPRVV